jgi:hypothetical protein
MEVGKASVADLVAVHEATRRAARVCRVAVEGQRSYVYSTHGTTICQMWGVGDELLTMTRIA